MIIKANKDFILSGKVRGFIFRQVNGKTVVCRGRGPKDTLTRKRPSYQKQFLEEAIAYLSDCFKNESVKRSYELQAKSYGVKTAEAAALWSYIAEYTWLDILYPESEVL